MITIQWNGVTVTVSPKGVEIDSNGGPANFSPEDFSTLLADLHEAAAKVDLLSPALSAVERN